MAPTDASTTRARVGVITVSYRSSTVLGPMLESLRDAGSSIAAGVVADNHPEADVERLADGAGIDYLPLENRGYGAAVNAATRRLPADVDWILVSNPDVLFEPSAVDRLVDAGSRDDRIGAVGPRILDENGSVYPSARAIPSLRMGIGHALFSKAWPTNPWTRRYLGAAQLGSDDVRDAGWLSGACVLIRRSAFDQIGGFDEDFFMYFEDVDLGHRLGKAGYRNVYAPSARIRHIGGTSTELVSERMITAHHRSAEIFLARKYPGPVLAPLRFALRLGLRARERVLRLPR